MRGFFHIGIYQPKTTENVGTLWRSAYQLGASGIFTVGRRYKIQVSDTLKAVNHIPLFHYADFDDLHHHLPYSTPLIGVEIGGLDIRSASHPERAVYLLGSEDNGLPREAIRRCHFTISLPSVRTPSFNVAMAGTIVMYDRMLKVGS